MKLLTNISCFCPHFIGVRDILIAGGKIERIANPGELSAIGDFVESIPCEHKYAFPGIIDQHVHIVGGGGEEGPESSITEIGFSDIIGAGVTTLVGVLGMDSCTKSLRQLYTKARALEFQGITTYIYTGSYAIPATTLTNSIIDDLVFVDKVVGTGEVAISDHRSSLSNIAEFVKLAAETHIGGLLGCKAGVVHIHVGDGKDGLDPLMKLLDRTDLPVGQFIPTHVNRSAELFRQAAKYCKSGGIIDLTAGECSGVPVPKAIEKLIDSNVDLSMVTISSDANGSYPGGGVSRMHALYKDIQNCIVVSRIPPEIVFRFVTENVARILKLYPAKGVLQEGSDADILITDYQFNLVSLLCRGNMVINNGEVTGASL